MSKTYTNKQGKECIFTKCYKCNKCLQGRTICDQCMISKSKDVLKKETIVWTPQADNTWEQQ